MSKKGTKAAPKEVASYNERDIVLGKVRGFPPWPGMVCAVALWFERIRNPESVPPSVQAERPGKKNNNFYCVQFFPTDISKLQTVEIEAYINEPFKKSGELLKGYKTALDPTTWEAQRASAIAAAAEASDDAEEDKEDDVDELASDSEAKKPAAKSRKRKRESLEPKTRKTPKEREREKQEGTGAKGKKEKEGGAGKGKKGRKSKTTVESEDERAGEGDDDAEGEEVGPSGSKKDAGSPPPAKKARREEDGEDAHMQNDQEALRVREWRHRLQKAFLSAKNTPDEADMPTLDALFSTVEAYDSMTVAYLQFSKIGKVMRHITLLKDNLIPRDAEFRFRARAQTLVEKWQNVLGAAKEGGSAITKVSEKPAEKEVEKEAVNGASEVNGSGASHGNGETAVTDGAARIDLNGTEAVATETADAQGDGEFYLSSQLASHLVLIFPPVADMAAPTDADAPGEADGEVDTSGQADAPGEAEDVPIQDVAMAEA
ncbi:hypothetical protein H0H87_009629 [Tephrocybe sp. NHM501043]|nr:hypothetical protein H0H87_009629 [Tephrocybe sp. NHM501043]